MIKRQTKVLIVFVYQWYWMILFKMDKNYFPEVLEEYKYIIREKEMTKYINDDLELSSDLDESDKE